MREAKEAIVPTVRSAIVSYVLAQGTQERISGNLEQLRRFLKEKGMDISTEELSRRVKLEVRRLEAPDREARRLADLFKGSGKVRAAKYRKGSAFCGGCGMYKDFKKECEYCGKVELTV